MKITLQQKKNLKKIAQKYHLKLILLYGSAAKNSLKKTSDIDIAILPEKELSLKTFLSLHTELSQILGNDFKRELDLVDLRKKDPLFLYQVAKNCLLLYGELNDFNEFRAFAFRYYLDSRDLRNLEKKLVEKAQKHLEESYAG